MRMMAKLWKNRRYVSGLAGLCVSLCLGQGCARSAPSQPREAASTGDAQNLPFHPGSDQPSGQSSAPLDSDLGNNLPFRERSRTLPAGTLVTVQLKDPLSSVKVHAGDSFAASVAVPLTIAGNTLVEPGTEVTGRVESTRSHLDRSQPAKSSGYIRLSLNTLNVGGREIALQTSSLFARGMVQGSEGVRLAKGRHLTFRLTAPVALDDPNTMAKGQSQLPSRQ